MDQVSYSIFTDRDSGAFDIQVDYWIEGYYDALTDHTFRRTSWVASLGGRRAGSGTGDESVSTIFNLGLGFGAEIPEPTTFSFSAENEYTQDPLSFELNLLVAAHSTLNLTVTGTEGVDVVVTGSGDDTVAALGGNDYIDTSAGNDTVNGGAGDDRIDGGGGNDTLDGRDGDDTLIGGLGADRLNGGAGSDWASYAGATASVYVDLATGKGLREAQGDTYTGIENVRGGSGDDILRGNALGNAFDGGAGNDQLLGQDGNDILIGGAGADVLRGSDGIDLLSYRGSAGGVAIDLSAHTASGGDAEGDSFFGIENVWGSLGDDAIAGSSAANELTGDAGDDTLDGADGNDILDGGAGNDRLIGGDGKDTMTGGDGDDDYVVDTTADTVIEALFGGTDTVSTALANYTLGANLENLIVGSTNGRGTGNWENNTLWGSSGNNTLDGGYGHDTLDGRDGNDTLIGGWGSDRLNGGTGSDWASYAGAAAAVRVELATGEGFLGDAQGDSYTGIENVRGGNGDDILRGDANANTLAGGAGADRLFGQDGNDILIGGSGADRLSGDAGSDWASYAGAAAAVRVDLATRTGLRGDAQGDTYSGIENVRGGDGDDFLRGDANANTLDGGAGDDMLFGQDGNDVLIGGAGVDILRGSDGIDLMSYRGSAGGVAINLSAGTATGGDAEGDTFFGIENVWGSLGSDTIAGSSAANRLTGDAGDDVLDGANGNDIIEGGAGADDISGGRGNDKLYGNAGDDAFHFNASSGQDILYGFVAGSAIAEDRLVLDLGPAYQNFVNVMASATMVNGNTVFHFGAGLSVTLVGVDKGSIAINDIAFPPEAYRT